MKKQWLKQLNIELAKNNSIYLMCDKRFMKNINEMIDSIILLEGYNLLIEHSYKNNDVWFIYEIENNYKIHMQCLYNNIVGIHIYRLNKLLFFEVELNIDGAFAFVNKKLKCNKID